MMVGSETLCYRGRAGDSVPIRSDIAVTLTISGPDWIAKSLRSSNPLLSIERLRIQGEGQRTVTSVEGDRMSVNVSLATARVEGQANGTPFRFDFESGSLDEPLADNPFGRILRGIVMGGWDHRLGATGQYSISNAGQDPTGEALRILLDAPARLPNRTVAVAEKWTNEWRGERQSKKGGMFAFRQSARIQEISTTDPARARIAFDTTATMEFPASASGQGDVAQLTATGATLLDLSTGAVVATESSGTVTSDVAAVGVQLRFDVQGRQESPGVKGPR